MDIGHLALYLLAAVGWFSMEYALENANITTGTAAHAPIWMRAMIGGLIWPFRAILVFLIFCVGHYDSRSWRG